MPTSVRVFQQHCPRNSTKLTFNVRVFQESCPHVARMCNGTPIYENLTDKVIYLCPSKTNNIVVELYFL